MGHKKFKYPEIKNFINGTFKDKPLETLEVKSPLNGTLLSFVPLSDRNVLNEAVEVAEKAFLGWRDTPIKERSQIFYKYRSLLENNIEELTALVREENGKTDGEAKAEIEKCIELTEFACSIPQLIGDEFLELSLGVECRVERRPIGVIASIVPFNFPRWCPIGQSRMH